MNIKLYIVFIYFIAACNTSGSQHAKNKDVKDSSVHDSMNTIILEEDSIDYIDANEFDDNSIEYIDEEEAEEDTLIIDTVACGLKFTAGKNYAKTKAKIEAMRQKLADKYTKFTDSAEKEAFIDSVSIIFTDNLLNEIIPYWYGTVWDFDGYTAVPNKGMIACGYFVSTTLKHMGLKINRYKLAQQSATSGAKTLAIENDNVSLRLRSNYDNTNDLLNDLKDGLYFVGLDNHVGYLYIKNHIPYFIHSNYIEGYVMAERAEASEAFWSEIYYLTKISENKDLIKYWLLNKEVKVILDKQVTN